MRYSRFLHCLSYLLVLPLFSSCQTISSIDKPKFNAYLPHSFESYFESYEPLEENFGENMRSTEKEEIPADPNVWNVSDVDISYIDERRKLVAFTFDDSPSRTMESIFAVFADYNEQNPDCRATATLFCNGVLMDEHSLHLLHTANILGFELGNHTYSHLDLTSLSKETLQSEIDRTDELLSRIDGKPRHLLRAPFGKIDQSVKEFVDTPIVNWTIDTLDWTKNSEENIYNTVISNLFSGAIVLMHDGYPATIDALKRLLPDLKEKGYQIVSVSALAKAHGCVLRCGSEYIRARKQPK